jgi:lipopolysaccharide transport system ATP-binding protein
MSRVRAREAGVRFLFDRQKRVVTPLLARLRRRGSETWGLRGATFDFAPGDGVALLGRTGSGKTTLLRMVAGIYCTDEGALAVEGRVGSLLAIDAGLSPSLTGRENAQLLCTLAGAAPTAELLTGVRERSGLGEQFERPVSSFSQGMRARLGFAVAEQMAPEILVLDEVHEALDHRYRALVERRAAHIRSTGGIVVAAGHDHHLLERFCDRALVLERGAIVYDGRFADGCAAYLATA